MANKPKCEEEQSKLKCEEDSNRPCSERVMEIPTPARGLRALDHPCAMAEPPLKKQRTTDDVPHPVGEFPAGYDWTKSTQENYKVEWDAGVLPTYEKQRLGFKENSYFQNYTRERQEWQDAMVKQTVEQVAPTTGATPWLIFTCGNPGAGKGFVMKWLSNDVCSWEGLVHVDADQFKMDMPEWLQYKAKGEESVDEVCGTEANFIADLTQEVALSTGRSVCRHTTLNNAERTKQYMTALRQRLPTYKIAVFYIFTDETIMRARLDARAEETGRIVTEDYLDDCLANTTKSLTTLQSEVDCIVIVDNSGKGGQPILSSLSVVDRSHNWERVKAEFESLATQR